MAVSFASSPRSSLRKTNTRKTSPMPSPDGGSTKISPDSHTQAQSVRPARCSLTSRFRRSIPHFLLDFPPAASLAMEHQRHLPVSVEIRIPFRSLRHLMLCRPLGRPVSAHLNVVKHHLLFRHFVSRHLRQNVFNPRRDGLSAHQRCLPRHQLHAVFSPHLHLHMAPCSAPNLSGPCPGRKSEVLCARLPIPPSDRCFSALLLPFCEIRFFAYHGELLAT